MSDDEINDYLDDLKVTINDSINSEEAQALISQFGSEEGYWQALLPMCFGFGEGASLRSPMALAVIGGLFTSTLMTLVVIPCVYYIFDKKVKNVEKI